MWLFNTCGFFSVVVKPGDAAAGMITVRARVKGDLDALRERYLPELGPLMTRAGTDYPFQAQAPRAAFAEAMSRLALELDYAEFKDTVLTRQGPQRARIYGKIWRDLIELEDEGAADFAAHFEPRMAWRLAKTVQRFRQLHGHWPTRIEMPRGHYAVLLLDIGQLWHRPMLDKLSFSDAESGIRALDADGLAVDYDRDVPATLDHREAFLWMFG